MLFGGGRAQRNLVAQSDQATPLVCHRCEGGHERLPGIGRSHDAMSAMVVDSDVKNEMLSTVEAHSLTFGC
jgi:hypothetical protein